MRKRGTKSSTSTSSVASASAPKPTPSSSSPSTSAPKKGKGKGKGKGNESGRSGSRTTGRGGSSSHKQGGSAGTPTNSGTCATHTVPNIKKGFLFFPKLIPLLVALYVFTMCPHGALPLSSGTCASNSQRVAPKQLLHPPAATSSHPQTGPRLNRPTYSIVALQYASCCLLLASHPACATVYMSPFVPVHQQHRTGP